MEGEMSSGRNALDSSFQLHKQFTNLQAMHIFLMVRPQLVILFTRYLRWCLFPYVEVEVQCVQVRRCICLMTCGYWRCHGVTRMMRCIVVSAVSTSPRLGMVNIGVSRKNILCFKYVAGMGSKTAHSMPRPRPDKFEAKAVKFCPRGPHPWYVVNHTLSDKWLSNFYIL